MVNSYLTPKLREGESVDLSLYSPRERTNIRMYGLDYKHWTPADVVEFKRKWKPEATQVTIHGNYDKAKRWCRENCYHQDFNLEIYANPDDSHLIHFRRPEDAMIFKIAFSG